MEPIEIKPLTLTDFFDQCFHLIRSSAKQLLPVGLAISIPVGILGWWLMRYFFAAMLSLAEADPQFEADLAGDLAFSIAAIAAFSLVYLIGETLLYVAFTLIYAGETVGRHYDTGEIFSLTLSGRGVRAVVQRCLALFAASMVYIVPYFLVILVAVTEMGVLVTLVALLVPVLGFAFFIYLLVRWAFGLIAITWEQEGIVESFQRSAELVRDNSWRTFGILAFFSILTAFVLSVVTSPLQFFVMWDFIKAYIDMIQVMAVDPDAVDPTGMLQMFANLGFGFALLISINMFLQTAIKSSYLTTLYFDLRARNNEFGYGESDSI